MVCLVENDCPLLVFPYATLATTHGSTQASPVYRSEIRLVDISGEMNRPSEFFLLL